MNIKKSYSNRGEGPLQIRDFRLFLVSRFFTTSVFQSLSLCIHWQILVLTQSPLALGISGLLEFTTHFLLAFFGGHIADRYPHRRILLFCITGISICSLFLLFIELSDKLGSYSLLSLGSLYAVVIFLGLIRAFFAPAILSFMAHIVPPHLYPKSSAWNVVVWQTVSVGAPALAGLLYANWGAWTCYLLNLFLLFLAFLLLLSCKKQAQPEISTTDKSFKSNLLAGLAFVHRNKLLAGALWLDLFVVLFGGAVALLPIFADSILEVGPSGLGLLRAAPALGAFLCSLLLVSFPINKNAGLFLFMSVSAFGWCMIFFAFSRDFYLSLFLMGLSGAFYAIEYFFFPIFKGRKDMYA